MDRTRSQSASSFPHASIGPKSASSPDAKSPVETSETSSAYRYVAILLLVILVPLHVSLALGALFSAMQSKQQCSSAENSRYGPSTYLAFVFIEILNVSAHAYSLFLIWQRRLNSCQYADCVLAVTCCWPTINLAGAMLIPEFLNNKNMATFFCLVTLTGVLMGLPPTHSFAQVVIGSPVFVLLDCLSAMQKWDFSAHNHLFWLSFVHYMVTRGLFIPSAGLCCSLCASFAVVSGQNKISSAAAATTKNSELSSATSQSVSLSLPLESFGICLPQWTIRLLLSIRHRVNVLSEGKYSSLLLCSIAFPIVIFHAVIGLGSRFLPGFETYLSKISGDQLCVALVAAFVLGRDSLNLDISYLLKNLNDARSSMFASLSHRPTATDLIDSVRRQVAETGEVAGDDEAGEDDVTTLEVLGEGSYGKVFKGTWRGTVVAIKTMALPAESSLSERNERLAIMEAAISSALSHPHIVQHYTYSLRSSMTPMQRALSLSGTDKPGPGSGSVFQSGSISGSGTGMEMRLIQEHMDGGSLFDALMEGIFSSPESDVGQVNYRALLETAADVARAMIHVHSLNILHNDIKARNVLLKSNDRDPRGVTCKLGDFGLAVKTDGSQETKGICGTLTHLAPETIQESIKSKATDVFAYGIMLHEIMCPGQLYVNANRNFLRHAVTLGKRPEFPVFVPMGYQHLATSCWDRDPKLRPSFKEILRILMDLIAEEESKGTQQKRPTSMVMNEDVQGDGEKKQSGVASSAAAPPNICHSTFDFHGSGIFVGSMIEEKERYEDVLEKMLADRDILTKSIDETLR